MDTVIALVLPYKKKLTQYQFLLHRELIPAWDQDKDLCGIMTTATLADIETAILAALKDNYGYFGELSELLSLGVCAGGRDSSEVYYLYAIDLTKAKTQSVDSDGIWVNEETLLESIDAQLCTALARARFLLL